MSCVKMASLHSHIVYKGWECLCMKLIVMELSSTVALAFPYLVVLYERCENKTLKNQLLKEEGVLHSLTEIIHNLLENRIVITKDQKRALLPYQNALIKLSKKSESSSRKLQILRGARGRDLLITVLAITLPAISQKLHYNGSKH